MPVLLQFVALPPRISRSQIHGDTDLRRTICSYAMAVCALFFACGKGINSNNTNGNVTITGQLQSGVVTQVGLGVTESALTSTTSSAVTGPLANYRLSCVTFASPPVAASGTADSSGNVSVTFAAQGVAFGCFVPDSQGNTVATLSFRAAASAGSALTLSSNASLGTISVDLNSGLASSTVSTGTVANTPPGSCPLGTWVFQTGPNEPACSSMAASSTARVWVAPAANGGFSVSLIHGPESHGQTTCSYGAWNGLPGTYASGVLSFGPFNGNGGGSCPNPISIRMTPSADCTTATAALQFEGCGSCTAGPNYCSGGGGPSGCGSTACNATVSGVRQ